MKEKVETWIREITLLSDIAVTQPQAAYSCFTAGYQHKMTYLIRNFLGCKEKLARVDEVIRHKLSPALTGGHIINYQERQLLALPPQLGGLGKSVTDHLQEQITGTNVNHQKKTRSQVKHENLGMSNPRQQLE